MKGWPGANLGGGLWDRVRDTCPSLGNAQPLLCQSLSSTNVGFGFAKRCQLTVCNQKSPPRTREQECLTLLVFSRQSFPSAGTWGICSLFAESAQEVFQLNPRPSSSAACGERVRFESARCLCGSELRAPRREGMGKPRFRADQGEARAAPSGLLAGPRVPADCPLLHWQKLHPSTPGS